MRIHRALVACSVIALAVAACASDAQPAPPLEPGDRIEGATGQFGGGTVTTFALSDGNGGVMSVGATFSLSVLASVLPEDASVDFPGIVKKSTFINHIYLTKSVDGTMLAARMVEKDHMDIHFMGITVAEREAIDCRDEVMPAPDLLPDSYVIPGLGDEAHGGTCVPKIGLHAVQVTPPELAQANPAPLTRMLVLGYHAGKLAFVESDAARAFLEQRRSFAFTVPRPSRVDRATRIPTRLAATFDAATDTYTLLLTDFVVPLSDVVTPE